MFLLKASFCTALAVTAYHWMRQLIVDRLYLSRVCCAVVNPGISVGGNSIPRTPLDKYSDKELIEAVCNNDQQAIVHLFYKKCLPTFQYHIYKLFPYKEDVGSSSLSTPTIKRVHQNSLFLCAFRGTSAYGTTLFLKFASSLKN